MISDKRKHLKSIVKDIDESNYAIRQYDSNLQRAISDYRYRNSYEWEKIRAQYRNASNPSNKKRLVLERAQAEWELGKSICQLDKMLGRESKIKVSMLSPKTVDIGKKTIIALSPLMAATGFGALAVVTGGLTTSITRTNELYVNVGGQEFINGSLGYMSDFYIK